MRVSSGQELSIQKHSRPHRECRFWTSLGTPARYLIQALLLFLTAFVDPNATAAVWYVDKDNTGTEDGTSWATAFNTIQEGLDAASPGDDVWVAEGVYNEARTSPNADGGGLDTGSILLRANVDVYGGFAGNETLLSQRDWQVHDTILDGYTSRGGDRAIHVIVAAEGSSLDGFTVRGGGAFSHNQGNISNGGGLIVDGVTTSVKNCKFIDNRADNAGAIALQYTSSLVSNCEFRDNVVYNNPGGSSIRTNGGSPVIEKCRFYNGNVGGQWGGLADIVTYDSPLIENCIFFDGGIEAEDGTDIQIINSNVYGLIAEGNGTTMAIKNSIVQSLFVQSNAVVTIDHSNLLSPPSVQGTLTQGSGMLSIDPLYKNASEQDYRLRSVSLCIDGGTVAGAPATDIDGNARPQQGGVDIGAYEFVAQPDTDGDGLPNAYEAAQGCTDSVIDARLFVVIDTPSDGGARPSTPITISGTVSSAYMDFVTISTDGGATFEGLAPVADRAWSYEWTPPAQGTYSIHAKASNVFDGVSVAVPITVTYTTAAPQAFISAPLPDQRIIGSIPIAGGASAGSTGFLDYKLEYLAGSDPLAAGTWTTITTSTTQVANGTLYGGWNVSPLADGPYVLRLTVRDNAAINTSVTHRIVYVDHDTIPPGAPSGLSISGGLLATAVANSNDVLLSGAASAGSVPAVAEILDSATNAILKTVSNDITVHLNGAVRGTFALPASISAENVRLRLSVKDQAGNVSTTSLSNSLPVDNAGPSLAITFPFDGASLLREVHTVTGTASDVGAAGLSKIEFSLDNVLYSNVTGLASWSHNWSPAADLPYTLYARGADLLGNVTVYSIEVEVSDTFPAAYISSPTDGQTFNAGANVSIQGTAKDASNFKEYLLQYAPGTSPTEGYVNITPSPVSTAVTNGTLGIWDTTGIDAGTYTIRLLVTDFQNNTSVYDRHIEMLSTLSLRAIPDATLNEDATLLNYIHLPNSQYTSALSGDPETFTYTVLSQTNPGSGVTVDAGRNIDIQPAANWNGTSTVTIQVTYGALTDTDAFVVTVNPVNDAPTQPSIAITPSNPADSDGLIASVTVPSTDADGTPVSYRYQWAKSNDNFNYSGTLRDITTTSLLDLLSNSMTLPGEYWRCSLTATDGISTTTAVVATVRVLSSTSISASVTPLAITLGESISASAVVSPNPGNVPVSFNTLSPTSQSSAFPHTGYVAGTFSGSFLPTIASEGRGPWTLYASWTGNATYLGAQSSVVSFTVAKAQPTLSLTVSDTTAQSGANDISLTAKLVAPVPSSLNSVVNSRALRVYVRDPEGFTFGPINATTGTDGKGEAVVSPAMLSGAGVAFTKTGVWEFIADFLGDYNLKYASTSGYGDPNVARVTVKAGAGYAVIMVGKYDANGEGLPSHGKTGDKVYLTLIDRNFDPSDIRYYREGAPAAGVTVYDNTPSQADLQSALLWASGEMNNSPGPLYLVLIDHGSPEQFYIHSGSDTDENRIVSPAELDSYLTSAELLLNDPAKQEPRIIIYGACHSGSFVPEVSAPGRIIIASANYAEKSYRGPLEPDDIRDGEVFVSELFRNLGEGLTLKRAFEIAAEDVVEYTESSSNGASATRTQTPQLDDNADGESSSYELLGYEPGEDGSLSHLVTLGIPNNAADDSISWKFATTPPTLGVTGPLGTLSATTLGVAPANTVAWIEVKSPTYSVQPGGSATFQLDVVMTRYYGARMTDNADGTVFQFPLGGLQAAFESTFSGQGTYKVFYYLKDGLTARVSSHILTTVYRSTSGNDTPSQVTLLYPPNDVITHSTVFLAWNASTDNHPITYTVEFAEDQSFTLNKKTIPGITDTFKVIGPTDGIIDGKTYWWRVTAVDTFGAASAPSASRSFRVDNSNSVVPGVIAGRVTDALSGLAVKEVPVQITKPTVYVPVNTNQDGYYYFAGLPAGEYDVRFIEQPNYPEMNITGRHVANGELTEVNFVLQPSGLYRWGEVSGDSVSGTTDAAYIKQWVAGLRTSFPVPNGPTPGHNYPDGGDVNAAGGLGAGDATDILKKKIGALNVGTTGRFTADTNQPWEYGPETAKSIRPARGQVTRIVSAPSDIIVEPSESFVVPIEIDDASGVESVVIKLEYDPIVLDLIDVHQGSLTQGWGDPVINPMTGQVIVVMADVTELTGAGSLVEFSFQAKSDAQGRSTDLTLSRVELNDTLIPAIAQNGSVQVTGTNRANINGDGNVDALDIQLAVNAALGIDIEGLDADVNGDGSVDASDIQAVINAALGIVL